MGQWCFVHRISGVNQDQRSDGGREGQWR